jgi:uncharacterized caspase-like protein/tetratricopeptide (TPR) repeat protein
MKINHLPLVAASLIALPGFAWGAAVKPAAKPKPKPPASTPAKQAAPPSSISDSGSSTEGTDSAETPAPASPPAAAEPDTHTWALLVGVSKYQNPAIVSLRFPASDATAIHDALVDPQLGRVPASNVKLLTDESATATNILGAVDDFLKPNVQPGDKVVIFLAGHGVAKGVGVDAKSYFLGTDVRGATTAMLDASAVNLQTLSAKLSTLPATQFIVFVDACREDPTPGRGIKGNTMSDVLSRGLTITPTASSKSASTASFFACSIGQRAFEDPSLNHGVFTYWIMDGIRAAAVPRRPDGAVDMGVLASYVKDKVEEWAKNTSAKGDFEVEQTPEFVTSQLNDPIVLMTVKRPLPDPTLPASQPSLEVITDPEGAQVTINGEKAGAAPLSKSLSKGGQYTLKVEATGFAPVERTVNVLDGYTLQVTVNLQGGPLDARGVAQPADSAAAALYKRAQDAETQRQWEIAEAGYDAVISADGKFTPAYESLADLRLRRGKVPEAIGALTKMVAAVPSVHSYSLLSRAYSLFAEKNAVVSTGDDKKEDKPKKKGGLLGKILGGGNDDKKDESKTDLSTFVVPKNAVDAAAFAKKAADEAVKLDSSSGEAQLALGMALIAGDKDGKNKDDALAALGKAAFMEPKNASVHYGMGYGIRNFAEDMKDENDRKSELQRAVSELKQALDLRPDYYEAHRELAFCYHLMGDLDPAQKEYELANSYRGGASDEDEIAAVNLSLSAIHTEEAAKSTDDNQKKEHLAASDGYQSDAKEVRPDLTRALMILNRVALGPRIRDFLPSEMKRVLNLPGDIRSKINVPLSLPGLP